MTLAQTLLWSIIMDSLEEVRALATKHCLQD